MSASVARLLFPAIRWDSDKGFEGSRQLIDTAIELGVGGFILFGGEADAVRALTTEMQDRSAHYLLIGADLERGAGQQFNGATALPPQAAFGFLDDELLTERAGHLTAMEARALGINWVYSPVADVDLEPHNPIVGTRSFGSDAERVSRHVAAWIRGCHQGRALACAKHFPGHGRTTTDSHSELPEVNVDAGALNIDLAPFRQAIKSDVNAIMTAHVSYPALDTSGTAATLSPRVITGLLRKRLEFDGLVVTDAMVMEGVLHAGNGEERAAVLAVAAGCDCLLYPNDVQATVRALEAAIGKEITQERIDEALHHIDRAASNLRPGAASNYKYPPNRTWGVETGAHAVHSVRGVTHISNPVDIYVVDDDLGGPFPAPARQTFFDALANGGVKARAVESPTKHCMVAAFCDIRAWKKRWGLAPDSIVKINAAVSAGADFIILFGHPRIASQFKGANVLCAWGGEAVMQQAAAHKLLGLLRK